MRKNKNRRKEILNLSTNRKILLLPDIHIPFHDTKAIRSALSAGLSHGCDTVILLGDTMDCHMLSTHKKMKGALDMTEEVKQTRSFLKELRREFEAADIYYLEGNHEERLTRHLSEHSPALQHFDAFSIPSLLRLEEDFNIEYRKTGHFITCGDLTFIHGHEMRGLAGVNPSRKLYLKSKCSVICGHMHRPESFFTRDIRGEHYEAHVLGTLGTLDPHYHPYNEWRHGFGIAIVNKDGSFKVDNITL
jgi:predicted phosphodiesterase